MSQRRNKPKTAFTKDQLSTISEAMDRAGMKDMADLARAVEMVPQSVYKWFTGERGASDRARLRVAGALDVAPEALGVSPEVARGHIGAAHGGRAAAKRDTVGATPGAPNAEIVDWIGKERRPLIEFGACGVPAPSDGLLLERWDGEDFPLPESQEARDLIGPRGYAVRIRGQSMTRWRLRDGDVVWVNPEKGRAAGYNRPVLARLLDDEGNDLGMVVKVLALDENGREYLHSAGEEGDNDVKYRLFEFFGVCVRRSPRDEPLVLDVNTPNGASGAQAAGPYYVGGDAGNRKAG